MHRLAGHQGKAILIAYSGDGKWLASADCASGLVKVWKAEDGKLAWSQQVSTRPLKELVLSPTGTSFAVLGQDGIVRLYPKAGVECKILVTLPRRQGANLLRYGLAFSPDGSTIAGTAPGEPIAELWDAKTGNSLFTFRGHTAPVFDVAFSPDGKRLATLGQDEKIRVWDATTPPEALVLKKSGSSGFLQMALGPDGNVIGLIDRDFVNKTIRLGLFDQTIVPLAAKIGQMPFPAMTIQAISPGGKLVAVHWKTTPTPVLLVFDSIGGEELLRIPLEAGTPVNAVAFSPDGTKLAAAFLSTKCFQVWEVKTGKVLHSFEKFGWLANDVRFSSDGSRLALGWWGGTVTCYDLVHRKVLFTVKAHDKGPAVASFRPDGKRLVSGGGDGLIRVWDAVSGEMLSEFPWHTTKVASVTYSPDGHRVASGSSDQTIKIWEPETGRELLSLGGVAPGVYTVAFTPDGHRLVSRHSGGIALHDGTPWGQAPAPLPKLK
jgi:WD40 repeat protein